MARLRPKVLVVDDDAATRDGLTALLESWAITLCPQPTVKPPCKGVIRICLTRS